MLIYVRCLIYDYKGKYDHILCDHQVIYYKECKTEEEMNTTELIVLSKLNPYKEQTNCDRFILPEDTDISLFTKIVDECILFVSL